MYERQSCYLKHSETVLYIFITNIYIYINDIHSSYPNSPAAS